MVAENEPFWVHGGETPAAVWLDSGASATSPAICVSLDDPTMRFFARSAGGPSGQLAVDVLYTDADGAPQELRIGTVNADEAEPTRSRVALTAVLRRPAARCRWDRLRCW